MGGLSPHCEVHVVAHALPILREFSAPLSPCIALMASGRGSFMLRMQHSDLSLYRSSSRHQILGILSQDCIYELPVVDALEIDPIPSVAITRLAFLENVTLLDALPISEQFEMAAAPIRSEVLREFLRQVFDDTWLNEAFFDAPASHSNHHAFRGGLAAHSIETAGLFHRAASGAAALPKWQIEVGTAAALLHDIGKVVPISGQPRIVPKHHRHEAAALNVIRGPLEYLAEHEPEYARAIRYCLYEHRQQQNESGRLIHCLRSADQLSAAACNEAVAEYVGKRAGDHLILNGRGPERRYFSPRLRDAA